MHRCGTVNLTIPNIFRIMMYDHVDDIYLSHIDILSTIQKPTSVNHYLQFLVICEHCVVTVCFVLQSVTACDVRSSSAASTSQRTLPAQHVPTHPPGSALRSFSPQPAPVCPPLPTQPTPRTVTAPHTPSAVPTSPANGPRCTPFSLSTRLPSCCHGFSIPAHSLTSNTGHLGLLCFLLGRVFCYVLY